jgi:transposase-like protein
MKKYQNYWYRREVSNTTNPVCRGGVHCQGVSPDGLIFSIAHTFSNLNYSVNKTLKPFSAILSETPRSSLLFNMLPTASRLQHLFSDEEICVTFLLSEGILYGPQACGACGRETVRHKKVYQCRSKGCRKSVSILKESFFSGGRLSVNLVMQIAYLWLLNMPSSGIRNYTGHSSATIASYLKHLRQLVSDHIRSSDLQIGGEGVIVEVDESKFGKRKYNRGHQVEGVWVVGGVERTGERLAFLETVQDRSANTLLDIIQRNVLPGTIIYSDLWKGYSSIQEICGLQHHTVNHSTHFVDPDTGVHTNTIEGTWNGIKLCVPPRNRNEEDMEWHLGEFIWRRQNQDDMWGAFLRCLAATAYV